MMMSSKQWDISQFHLFLRPDSWHDYFWEKLKNFFKVNESESKITLDEKVKWNFGQLEYFSRPRSRSKHFRKRLGDYSSVIDSEFKVTLGTKIMMTSSKCLDFSYFEVFSLSAFKGSF